MIAQFCVNKCYLLHDYFFFIEINTFFTLVYFNSSDIKKSFTSSLPNGSFIQLTSIFSSEKQDIRIKYLLLNTFSAGDRTQDASTEIKQLTTMHYVLIIYCIINKYYDYDTAVGVMTYKRRRIIWQIGNSTKITSYNNSLHTIGVLFELNSAK